MFCWYLMPYRSTEAYMVPKRIEFIILGRYQSLFVLEHFMLEKVQKKLDLTCQKK